ncbi:hypothetical protein ACS0TY_018652 [Phlomoides rotata]
MVIPRTVLSILLIILVTISSSIHAYSKGDDDFLRCLSFHSKNYSETSLIIYTPGNSSYQSALNSTSINLRFTASSTPRPLFIVTPVKESQIQAVVLCARENGLQLRTRSGGHDYEGLSYTSQVPFIVIDLVNMSGIKVDADEKTAWVQAGATIGQLYYEISQRSRTLAFPSGTCPTVGVGGHFSGGGYGSLLRKYGLAADNIVDARLVDVEGRIHDRKSMGEELFWAIRGGGGASFGVITDWKLKLVSVPEIVTVFSVNRTLEENATQLIYKWQYVAPNLAKDLYLSASLNRINSSKKGEKTILATFNSLFLGRRDELQQLLQERFPELGVKGEDCNEMSWVQSALFFGGYDFRVSPQVLASKIPLTRLYFKAKSDYVKEPVSKSGFEGIWKFLYEKEADRALLILVPYGGRMNEISESAIPFPHRAGNLYKIQHLVYWDEPGRDASTRDLDLGVNNEGNTSYAQASIWGLKYFNVKEVEEDESKGCFDDEKGYVGKELKVCPKMTYEALGVHGPKLGSCKEKHGLIN